MEQINTVALENQGPAFPDLQPHAAQDFHSYSNPHQIRVNHLDLELHVFFDQRVLQGTVVLSFERLAVDGEHPLIVDTRDLSITKTEISINGSNYFPTSFSVGPSDPILGAPLIIQLPQLPDKVNQVRIEYSTSPHASGLQWLDPPQTAGKNEPFMFTQSQPIHARSWIPLQDSPQVRVTYSAKVRTPRDLLAVMSAGNHPEEPRDGNYSFKMDQPIPSYLIALAVGDLTFKSLSQRTGVYAETPVIEKAAWEFAETEKMIEVAERLYGPYRWERYDLLVLPPSFPWGGMENPRLTFISPTVLTGDKSLISLVAHELAHAWSGNLVSNATWRDFWLNEGFTVYVERRILEEVYGRPRAEMEAVLGRQNLENNLATLESKDKIMHIDLKGRDPDAGITRIPYDKGALFLRHLEETFGRAHFDQFLRGYFNHFAFQSITTADFIAYLRKSLLDKEPQLAVVVPVDEWIYQANIPSTAPQPKSNAFEEVERQAEQWLRGEIPASNIQAASWTTHEWLHFLRYLPQELNMSKIEELDQTFQLTHSANPEIAHQWLLMAIQNHYEPAYPRLKEFLTSTGRRKLIKPLYEELVKTPEGNELARTIYDQARPTYHPIAVATIDKIVKWNKE